ncbi:MAG: sulfotransferase [Methyloligellaceae bacterium]
MVIAPKTETAMLERQDHNAAATANRKARRAARKAKKKPDLRQSGAGDGAKSDPLTTLMEQAQAHLKAGRLQESERCCRQVIKAEPEFAEAYFQLANLFHDNRQLDEAYGFYKRAVTFDDGNPAYWSRFGGCLQDMRQYSAAVIAFERVVDLLPDDCGALIQLGTALNADGKVPEALASYEKAIQINPGYWQAHHGKGEQHVALGEFTLARESYRHALKLDPECAVAYLRLVDLVEDPDELDSLIKRLELVIAEGGGNMQDVARLHFAAANGRKLQNRYDEAFTHFAAGNAIHKQTCRFDRDNFRRIIDDTIEGFPPEVFNTLKDAASDSGLPIFIVGMPRSGSTLVEQILSSHPGIADAGEFTKLGQIVRLLGTGQGNGLSYPRDIAECSAEALRVLGEDYLTALINQHLDHTGRITDKRLTNFLQLGLIAILFPKAAIIHCRRDPMATCLSCYFQNFREQRHLAWTNDLEDLGFFYRQYERLMAHWRCVLPGRMFEVDYEEMVADQENMSRKLIGHIGLPWDDACLDFHNSKRGVRTASVSQVRKPIYKSSLAAWRKYEKHLAPLKRALGLDEQD